MFGRMIVDTATPYVNMTSEYLKQAMENGGYARVGLRVITPKAGTSVSIIASAVALIFGICAVRRASGGTLKEKITYGALATASLALLAAEVYTLYRALVETGVDHCGKFSLAKHCSEGIPTILQRAYLSEFQGCLGVPSIIDSGCANIWL